MYIERGGGLRRGGRGGGSMDGVEKGERYISVMSFSISTGGRLGGYIDGVDDTDDWTGEPAREFTLWGHPAEPPELCM